MLKLGRYEPQKIQSSHLKHLQISVAMVLTLIYWTLPLIFFLLLGFLSFALYVHHQHLRYAHIPGPPRDSFFTGNVPFFRREKMRERERKGKREHDIDELVSAIRIRLRCVDVLYSRCYPVWPWYGQKSPHHTKFAQIARTLLQTQQRVRPTSCGAGDFDRSRSRRLAS